MIFALIGDIRIGDATLTSPDGADEARKATLVRHAVATGKPVVQDMGDELDTRTLSFFFDETFCSPLAELARLEGLMRARSPVAYVGGDGAFRGKRWICANLKVETQKATPAGRATRLKVAVDLIEAPIPSPLDFLAALAVGAAIGIAGQAGLPVSAALSVGVGPLTAALTVGDGEAVA